MTKTINKIRIIAVCEGMFEMNVVVPEEQAVKKLEAIRDNREKRIAIMAGLNHKPKYNKNVTMWKARLKEAELSKQYPLKVTTQAI